jgi:hypothetical protein
VISYITASNNRQVLDANLLATIDLLDDDEIIVVDDPSSIAVAYNQGQKQARNPIRCYVHTDVQILKPAELRAAMIEHCTDKVGMVGLIGCFDRAVPWWEAREGRGAAIDVRMGLLDFGRTGPCAYLDGLLLATAQNLTWDESYTGFHMYDHDICEQMLARGLSNYCMPGGSAVLHNTSNPSDVSQLDGWDAAVTRFRGKWGAVA